MARGSVSKEAIIEKILETFDGAFKYEKEIRIPMEEDGERVEIKVTLTCAKTNVGGEDAPAEKAAELPKVEVDPNGGMVEPTEEEKKNISELLSKLGML